MRLFKGQASYLQRSMYRSGKHEKLVRKLGAALERLPAGSEIGWAFMCFYTFLHLKSCPSDFRVTNFQRWGGCITSVAGRACSTSCLFAAIKRGAPNSSLLPRALSSAALASSSLWCTELGVTVCISDWQRPVALAR